MAKELQAVKKSISGPRSEFRKFKHKHKGSPFSLEWDEIEGANPAEKLSLQSEILKRYPEHELDFAPDLAVISSFKYRVAPASFVNNKLSRYFYMN